MSWRWRRFPPLRADREPVTDEELRPLVVHHLEAGAPTGWFEPAYELAVATGRRLPWQEPEAHPWVGSWLDAPVLTPPGTRALVIGCGSGGEVVELARRGFTVVGLDVAPTALAWAAARLRREPRSVRAAVELLAGDLLHLDPARLDPVDLVVEVHTVPWLPGVVQDAAMAAIGPLLAPGGVAVTITQLRAEEAEAAYVSAGPP
ncbi:MAG: class I SAM-dependent methyltransferase, partial [Nitriliruptoraceae bacterium]